MKPSLEQLEERCVPAAVVDHGGPILAHPQVSDVFVGVAANIQPQMDALARVLTGPYDALLAPYGVGTGNLVGSVNVAAPTAGPLSDAQVQQIVTTEIAAHAVPPPDANSLYMVYLPQQVTDAWAANTGAYHSWFRLNGVQVPYTVCWLGDDYTPSHEEAEAATDPLDTGWYAGSTPDGGEICDLYPWQYVQVAGNALATFALPDGSEYQPPAPPFSLPQLLAIPLEEARMLAFDVLAIVDSGLFASYKVDAANTLANNPMLDTPLGRQAQAVGEAWFFSTVL